MTAAEKQQHYQITVDCWRLLLAVLEEIDRIWRTKSEEINNRI